MAGAAREAGDADSSRAPGLTSGLQGSMNVHRGALLLVPQLRCISSFVFYIHIASVLFCGLNNNYIRVLVHRLNNQVFVLSVTDRLFKNWVTSLTCRWQPIWPRWDKVDFTHIHAIIQLLQLYFKHIFLFYVKSILKIINFILFSALKLSKRNPHGSYNSVSLSGEKKRWKVSISYLIWLKVRRLVWNKVVIVEWLQKCVLNHSATKLAAINRYKAR